MKTVGLLRISYPDLYFNFDNLKAKTLMAVKMDQKKPKPSQPRNQTQINGSVKRTK